MSFNKWPTSSCVVRANTGVRTARRRVCLAEMSAPPRLLEVFLAALRLGCTSFGGPVAHIGYFREEFVSKRHWLDDHAYADLVALCQFLPGPASSQVVFALGMQRAGLAGAVLASLGFTLPSAVLMVLFGYGVTALGNLREAGWLHGLKLAAVAVVAQAVWGMGCKLCPDRARLTLALAAAAGVLIVPSAFSQIGAIAIGAAAGWWLYDGGAGLSGINYPTPNKLGKSSVKLASSSWVNRAAKSSGIGTFSNGVTLRT
jgi:chromate transporter